MGGCYSGSYGYSSPCSTRVSTPSWQTTLKSALKNSNREKLTEAYKEYFSEKSSGFIADAAKIIGITKVEEIPKEFPEIEYEVKFDIQIEGNSKEPGVKEYLDAFDFPVARNARFLKDPVNSIATGINRFYGNEEDEKLVVITKGNGTYLKEKGKVLDVDVGVKFQEIVVKRTESRWASEIDEVMNKIADATKNGEYKGRIRKEKGDVFILDSSDGRIYSFTFTRAHLTKAGDKNESAIQRQLEIEYAGYLKGFDGFKKDSEKQIVSGMVGLAKYTYGLYSDFPISGNWRGSLELTNERKYDFVSGKKSKRKELKVQNLERLLLPA